MEFEWLFSPPASNVLSSYYELLAVFLTSVLPRSCIPHQHSIWVCNQSRFGLAPCTANQNPETPSLVAKNGELVSDMRSPQLSSKGTQLLQGPRKQRGQIPHSLPPGGQAHSERPLRGFPDGPVVRTPRFHHRGKGQSLVKELRPCMP